MCGLGKSSVEERPADRQRLAGLAGDPEIVALGQAGIPVHVVGALGVEVARVGLLEVGDHLEHARVAAQFVAEREHDERRVIAEVP